MILKYAPIDRWKKKVNLSLLEVISQIVIIGFLLYINNEVGAVLVYAAIFTIGISIFRVFYYINMPQRDYVRIYEEYMMLHRGVMDPRRKIAYEDISKLSKVKGVFSIGIEGDDNEEIYPDQLSEADFNFLKKELEYKTELRVIEREEEEVV
ncbi:hypothetical protein LCM20_13380 [Halobacillus litoralis]|uniref:hypothetical protein n=1 Tax=Halobacillus litoralis TaxID=45668 RepID=UPI001CD3C424|nr:hypothetical protein [Halobacillus litoralis]MCA0971593.1 hypothetical protein [Halobacillus litoralis]